MAFGAWIDIIDQAEIVEEFGMITQCRRVAIVKIDTAGKQIGDVLADALNYYGMPKPGDALCGALPNVRLESRSPKIIGIDKNYLATVNVTLDYKLQQPSTEIEKFWRGSANVSQVRTQKDSAGNVITVTYGSNSQVPDGIDVYVPHCTVSVTLLEETNTPQATVDAWINKVNSATWRSGAAKMWLCSSISYEPVDVSRTTKRWNFTYTFEKAADSGGWTYSVAWRDSNGNIPSDAAYTSTGGLKLVEWHATADFTSKFGS